MEDHFREVSALFSVLLSNRAEKQLRHMDKEMLLRIELLFRTLEQAPVPAREYDTRKIRGEIDTYRIRLSSFRVTYRIFWVEKVIRIAKVELRSETTY